MKRIIKYCYPLLGALASCSAPAGQTGGLPSAPTPAQGTAAPQATAAQPLPATVPAGRSPWSPHVRSYSTPAGGTLFFKEACEQPAHAGEARCLALTQSDPDGTISSSTTPSGWGASDLQSAYRIPTTGGAGTTVAIVDANDDPNAETDLAIYRYQYGLPPCTTANGCFHKLNQAGAATPTPAADPGWSTEISLDLDMVSAACPLCNILLVEANSSNTNDLEAAEHTAVANGATFISNSWASSEFAGEESGNSSAFNYPGVAIFASSGDGGYGVGYPAASAFVTAVGGTTLTQATTLPNGGTNLRGWSETAWGGAGSGCSAYIAKPSWQHDTGCANRTVADQPFQGTGRVGPSAPYRTV